MIRQSLNGEFALIQMRRLLSVFDNGENAEKEIARVIVTDAITLGYAVSVDDGGASYTIRLSRDVEATLAAMFSTGEDLLYFRHPGTPGCVGVLLLIYGNGHDVISDYTDNVDMARILSRANRLSEALSAHSAA